MLTSGRCCRQSTNIFFRSPEGREEDGPSRAETSGPAADKMKVKPLQGDVLVGCVFTPIALSCSA